MTVFGCFLGGWMSHQVTTVLNLGYWYSVEGDEVCCEDTGAQHLQRERS